MPGVPDDTGPVSIPDWLRRAVSEAQGPGAKRVEDIAIVAGVAIGVLDAIIRRQERWAGAWRQRLALSAAVVAVKQARRVEDEGALRDAVLLTRSSDDVGPAGRMLLAWKALASQPARELVSEVSISRALENLGYAPDEAIAAALSDEVEPFGGVEGLTEALARVFAIVERYGLSRALGAWLADALLARRLGWTYAVPLLGTEPVGRSVKTEMEMTKALLVSQSRAAIRAIDLFAELGRRADRLLSVTPKLRAKGADGVVAKLLDEDAITGSIRVAGMSDRGLRRLFDRLIDLGAVRELSGRPTFRVYGL